MKRVECINTWVVKGLSEVTSSRRFKLGAQPPFLLSCSCEHTCSAKFSCLSLVFFINSQEK